MTPSGGYILAVIKAAAEAHGWDGRRSPSPKARAPAVGDILTGRGVALAFRSQTVVAEIVEVEVNRRTGVWAKRLVCAHDCGLAVNPEAMKPPSRTRSTIATGVRRRRVPFRKDRVLAALRAAGV